MKRFVYVLSLLACSTTLSAQEYVLIGWNDLGMHCSNKEFSNMAILPPYNNISAELIKKGDATHRPQLVTSGYTVTYEIPGNTYSVGKTNFWSYEDKLFGVSLTDNIGLTGNGLSGTMTAGDRYFEATGVPITPYTDANLSTESPYQLALLKAYDSSNNLIASTQCVVPVSNEISCVSSGCHSSETQLLSKHENEGGFNPNVRPILCANCHASAALGKTGKAGVPSLSQAIHDKHKSRTSDCYKCHPGATTKCLRDIMYSKGLTCQNCHGTLTELATSLKTGRRPWLDEPRCGSCHGSNHGEEAFKLYRQSRGHGGLFCSACHGSPHAIVPTVQANDNVQNIALQGYAGTLRDCRVCHGVTPSASGPHGVVTAIPFEATPRLPATMQLYANYPNPFNGGTRISFELTRESVVTVRIFDLQGRLQRTLAENRMASGSHTLHWDGLDENKQALPSGMYYCILEGEGRQTIQKMTMIK